ncbi:MAG: bifunctional oligoribonuclease/PAP phosphatase NrnA [Negativicutes bacterium]|nr:bifunctional oligoribonuclease/PAP phosphatase NrnA [Negativicutes bacterium]
MDINLAQINDLFKQANELVLTTHIHPDGDALGSLLALNGYLSLQGKKVTMLLDDDIPSTYRFLPGCDRIRRPSGRQTKPDLLVVLDASDVERIGGVYQEVKAPVLNIDHHVSNTRFADYLYLDDTAAATGEILCDLFVHVEAALSLDMASCLYTAIATDCGFFRYANTSAKTMRYGASLLEAGVKPNLISEQLETKPLSSIKTLTEVLKTLELHQENKIALITVTPEIAKDNDDLTEGLINYPRNIEGVELAIMLKAASPDTIRVSLRSRSIDVSRLALSFGGGGHARAAGCTIHGSLAAAKEKILSAAARMMVGKC